VSYSIQYTNSTPGFLGTISSIQSGNTTDLAVSPNPFTPDWPAVKNSLGSKLLDRAKGQQWNVPIFFAEAHKTANMVVARATNLVNLIRYARSGRLDKFFAELRDSAQYSKKRATANFNDMFAKRPSQAAANLLLETRYGWTPFMKDVYDAVHTLQDSVDTPYKGVGRVTARLLLSEESIDVVNANSQLYGVPVRVVGKTTRSGSCRAVWHFRPNPVDLPARFGMINPLEVIYELIPLSFVVDWFIPIGDYLSHFDSRVRFQHLGGTFGCRTEATRIQNLSSRHPSYSVSTSGAFGKTIFVERHPMTGVPELRLEGIRLEKGLFDLSITQMTTSLALLRQNVSRLPFWGRK
jgi:hypothetical protein